MLLTLHKSEETSKIEMSLICMIYNHFYTDELDPDNPPSSLSISFNKMFRHMQSMQQKCISCVKNPGFI